MDGVRMQKLLAGMRDRGATVAVVEASTEALSRGWMQVRAGARARRVPISLGLQYRRAAMRLLRSCADGLAPELAPRATHHPVRRPAVC